MYGLWDGVGVGGAEVDVTMPDHPHHVRVKSLLLLHALLLRSLQLLYQDGKLCLPLPLCCRPLRFLCPLGLFFRSHAFRTCLIGRLVRDETCGQ